MLTIGEIFNNRPSDLAAAHERCMNQVAAYAFQQAWQLEQQLHNFLCSGTMLRDLSLVEDYDLRRFDEPWRPPAPLRIR